MDKTTYESTFSEDDAPGWIAIDNVCESVYGGEPLGHFAPALPPILGGQGPDGVSVYRADDHLHYVTYGFSVLHYEPEAAGGAFSGWGFELTFRLKSDVDTQSEIPLWPVAVFQNLYTYVHESQSWFEPDQCILTTTQPLCSDLTWQDTEISGLGFVEDASLATINTPHGDVQFVQLVGLTRAEVKALEPDPTAVADVLKTLGQSSPFHVTDMARDMT